MSPGFTLLSSSLFDFLAVIFTVFIVSGSSTSFPSTLPTFLMSPVAPASTSTLIVSVTGVPGATVTSPKSTFLPSTLAVVGFVPVTFNPSGTSSVTVTLPVVFPLFVNVIV